MLLTFTDTLQNLMFWQIPHQEKLVIRYAKL